MSSDAREVVEEDLDSGHDCLVYADSLESYRRVMKKKKKELSKVDEGKKGMRSHLGDFLECDHAVA